MLSSADERQIEKEVIRCRNSKHYFAKRYLMIKDFDTSKPIPFNPNESQQELSKRWAQCRTLYCLKPRRQGISREAMSTLFHDALFFAHVNVSILHEDIPAEEMFTQVREWYQSLPMDIFRFKGSPFEAVRDRGEGIWFRHGGGYVVGSAKSLKLTGGHTFHLRHYAEISKFIDAPRIIRSVEGAASPSPLAGALYETTAEGGGYAFEQWTANNGWAKLFFPWTCHNSYKSEKSGYPQTNVDAVAASPQVADYIRQYGISGDRRTWFIDKLISLGFDHNHPQKALRLFHQEYPITPEIAFIVSVGAVFSVKFVGASPERGARIYEQPRSFAAYVMGVDTASGSEYGDFSAFVVLDCTNPKRPRVVYTFYDKIDTPNFAEEVQRVAEKFNALVAVGRDAHGADVMHRIQNNGYYRLYRETKFDRAQRKLTELLGIGMSHGERNILVNLLKEYVNDSLLTYTNGKGMVVQGILDERIRHECNGFQYITGERAEAVPPFHDDILFALAHGLRAMGQAHAEQKMVLPSRPHTPEEILRFEKMYAPEVRGQVSFANEGNEPIYWEPKELFATERIFRQTDLSDIPR